MAYEIRATAILDARDRSGRTFDALAEKAKRATRALQQLGRADDIANRASATTRAAGMVGRAAAVRGGGGMLVGGAAGLIGGALAARSVTESFTDYANFDRRLTRIGITADATVSQVERARAEVYRLANQYAIPVGQVVDGLEALVATGRTLDDSLSFLPSVSVTSQASGAALDDMAKSADAAGRSLGIGADQMQRAFDVMAAGGNAGMFEMPDMARFLPSLAPSMAVNGGTGIEGLRQLVAMLQVLRMQAGTSEEAATRAANIFQKMRSGETLKAFKRFGVDLNKELDEAARSGQDMLAAFVDISREAVGGDLTKLPQLFTDQQVYLGMQSLIQLRGEYDRLIKTLQNVDGTSMKNLARVSDDAKAAIDRLSNSWGQASVSFGLLLDKLGAARALKDVSDVLTDISAAVAPIADGIGTRIDRNQAFFDGQKQAKAAGMTSPAAGAAGARSMAGGDSALGLSWVSSTVEDGLTAAAKLKAATAARRLQTQNDLWSFGNFSDTLAAQGPLASDPVMRNIRRGRYYDDYTFGASIGGGPSKQPTYRPYAFAPADGTAPPVRRLDVAPADLSGELPVPMVAVQPVSDFGLPAGPQEPRAIEMPGIDALDQRLGALAERLGAAMPDGLAPVAAPVQQTLTLPPGAGNAMSGELQAVVQGPVTAELKGAADIRIAVTVEPSGALLTVVNDAKAATVRATGPLRVTTNGAGSLGVSSPDTE
ncbi:phage tail tape measure protein, TP901 family, core region [Pseudoxanthobacter soli DSM 19599]|uniref:Phage tail tape measure protein, TP901 family, core region n=1 Tax=Pseudoxanthobacter soli DSM 19599 TaxID=1123029 RepID=A0A1M7ZLP1_9HYPH|nr:phage tail tape measure protein [Pseudoxanthobacter soli]SHO65814.1 phage tail tape measure protein, TP901 family, core region [Pseudoxanthobacter soli DSM 19599]